MKRPVLAAWCLAILLPAVAASAGPVSVTFSGSRTVSKQWPLTELDSQLPADWSGFQFLVLEFRASSPQRFELEVRTSKQVISKRIQPMAGAWVRAAIPLKYYSAAPSGGYDLASLSNKPAASYFINIGSGGWGPLNEVVSLGVTMRDPLNAPTLEIRSVKLAKDSPGDEVLEPKVLVDEFGQWISADWPGKAKNLDDLKAAWAEEDQSLGKSPVPNRDEYGGFLSTSAKATGFFRVEKIDGRWWFIDPAGHYFFSDGANGIGTVSATRTAGRESIFTALPPANLIADPAGLAPTTGPSFAGSASFYTWNLTRRYAGPEWRKQWAALTVRRMADWGVNTFYGDPDLIAATPRQPYVITVRAWQTGQSYLGMPDVYADDFAQRVDEAAARACEPHKDDPYLIGYFLGNEPSWPGRESQLADLILEGASSATKTELKNWLFNHGDTAATRNQFALRTFEKYLTIIIAAEKRHDPNHLNLGIRFGSSPPAGVISLAKMFDVYSHNIYQPAPDPARLAHFYELTGRPILIGEFHVGVPGRGMAPGLVQAASQAERANIYSNYVENAAANPNVIGAHWFTWVDEPNTGRNDGENYNIGMVDVTDRPYPELLAAMKLSHSRLLDVRMGKIAPATRRNGAEAQ